MVQSLSFTGRDNGDAAVAGTRRDSAVEDVGPPAVVGFADAESAPPAQELGPARFLGGPRGIMRDRVRRALPLIFTIPCGNPALVGRLPIRAEG